MSETKIKSIRVEKGLTQKKLAKMAEMNEVQLRAIENGRGNPTMKTLERIADALEIPVDSLLYTSILGRNIKRIAREKNVSLKNISESIEMEYPDFLSFLEQDKSHANANTLEKIAAVLEVSINDILGTNYEFRDVPPGEHTNSESTLEATKQYFKQKEKLENFDSQVGRLTTDGKVKVYDYIDDLDPKYKKD